MSHVSVLCDGRGADAADLTRLVDSLVAQKHPSWELLLVGAGPGTFDDPRVRPVPYEGASVVGGLNAALDVARGNAVALVEPGWTLHAHAIPAVTVRFAAEPDADVVYTDEEWPGAGGAAVPYFKPDWSPVALAGYHYLGGLTAYRTSLVRAVSGFRAGTDGVHAWDLALRATPHARAVTHMREVLCRTSGPPWALDREAAAAVLAENLRGRDSALSVEPVDPEQGAWFRVRRSLDLWPRVSVVVPTAGGLGPDGGRLVDRCLAGLLDETEHGELDVCLVVSGARGVETAAALRSSYGDRARVVALSGPFNYSRAVNAGVRATSGEVVLLLNDDVEVLSADWLRRMVERACAPDVGVVGAKLLFPDGTIQHAGVVCTPEGVPGHLELFRPDGTGYCGDLVLDMEYVAVTGACQVMRRSVFDLVGGYDPGLPLNFNDVDFCLKVRALGLSVVQLNAARLRHVGSATRSDSVHEHETELFLSRWHDAVVPDPYARQRPGR